jgi:hypothetical protein
VDSPCDVSRQKFCTYLIFTVHDNCSPPYNISSFNNPRNIMRRIRITKFFIRNLLRPPVTSFLDPNIVLRTLFQTPSMYVPPLQWKTNFHTHTITGTKLQFCVCLLDPESELLWIWLEQQNYISRCRDLHFEVTRTLLPSTTLFAAI